ncbi:transmembrane protein 18-like [Nannochloropsis oceanica]
MEELDESQAGPASAVSEEMQNWAAEQVFKLAREQGAQPEGFWENAQAFAAAIDWGERWIQGLVAFHVLLWFLVIGFRKNMNVQASIFFFVCGLVAASEPLNTRLREKWWTHFSTQNYFDERGVFAVCMLTGPLIVLTCLQLCIFLHAAATMLVQVKRAELRSKHSKNLRVKKQQ